MITYGTQRDLLTQRQETSEKSYLFQNLSWENYFFQITPVDANGSVIGEPSDIVSIGAWVFNAAWWTNDNTGTCTVQWLTVSTARIWDTYYLVWPNIAGATNYLVYRSEFATNSNSNMQKIGETVDTKFAYPFDPYAVEDQYAHYAVQAVCNDGQTLQLWGTKSVKVWPATDLFFLFIVTLLWYLLYVLYGYSRVE